VFHVLGRASEQDRVVAERAECGVVGVAEQTTETGLATTFRGVTVASGELVIVVDHVELAQGFATDGTEPALGCVNGGDLHPAEALALRRGPAGISGG
jgi:hypothetical protein